MGKASVLEQLKQLVIMWNKHIRSYDASRQMNSLLDDYRKQDPADVEILTKLALVNYALPLANPTKALICLREALIHEPDNYKILLVYAYMHQNSSSVEAVLQILTGFHQGNAKEQALLYYVQSFYYLRLQDYVNYEAVLKKSLALNSQLVWSRFDLTKLFKETNNIDIAADLIKEAIKLVQEVYTYDDFIDIIDIDRFIDEHLIGTTLSAMNYASIQDLAATCIIDSAR